MILTKDSILKVTSLSREEVPFEEWGGKGATVIVGEMTALDRVRMRDDMQAKGEQDVNAILGFLLVRCILDEDGRRVFDDADAEALSRQKTEPLMKLFEVAARLNGLELEGKKKSKKK